MKDLLAFLPNGKGVAIAAIVGIVLTWGTFGLVQTGLIAGEKVAPIAANICAQAAAAQDDPATTEDDAQIAAIAAECLTIDDKPISLMAALMITGAIVMAWLMHRNQRKPAAGGAGTGSG